MCKPPNFQRANEPDQSCSRKLQEAEDSNFPRIYPSGLFVLLTILSPAWVRYSLKDMVTVIRIAFVQDPSPNPRTKTSPGPMHEID